MMNKQLAITWHRLLTASGEVLLAARIDQLVKSNPTASPNGLLIHLNKLLQAEAQERKAAVRFEAEFRHNTIWLYRCSESRVRVRSPLASIFLNSLPV